MKSKIVVVFLGIVMLLGIFNLQSQSVSASTSWRNNNYYYMQGDTGTNYSGYSAEYSKANLGDYAYTNNYTKAADVSSLGLTSEQMDHLRYMLGNSPIISWGYLAYRSWPLLNINGSVIDPKSWSNVSYDNVALKNSNLYFQYVFWHYIALAKNDIANFTAAQPAAAQFIVDNPELVNYYENGTMAYGTNLPEPDMSFSQPTATANAGEIIGPFKLNVDIPADSFLPSETMYELYVDNSTCIPTENNSYSKYKFLKSDKKTPLDSSSPRVKSGDDFYIKLDPTAYNGTISVKLRPVFTNSDRIMNDTLFASSDASQPLVFCVSTYDYTKDYLKKLDITVQNGLDAGRYSVSKNTQNNQDGYFTITDTTGAITPDKGMCLQPTVPLDSYLGYSYRYTNPQEITSKMGISLDTLYRMRYILAQSVINNNPADLMGVWPASFKDTSGSIAGSNPNTTLSFTTDSFNQSEASDPGYMSRTMAKITQQLLWKAVTDDPGQPANSLPAYVNKNVTANPDFVKYFYDRSSSTSLISDLTVTPQTVSVNKDKVKVTGESTILMGPYKLDSNNTDLYDLTLTGDNVDKMIFVDANGNTITQSKDGDEFYVKVDGVLSGSVSVGAKSTKQYILSYNEALYQREKNQTSYVFTINKDYITASTSTEWNVVKPIEPTNPQEPKAPEKEVFTKIPTKTNVREGDIIDYMFTGFANPHSRSVQDYQIIDIAPVGMEFVSGKIPAFTSGEGITYTISYQTVAGKDVIIKEGVDATKEYNFNAPKTSSHISEIKLFFKEVPANFGKNNTIAYRFEVGKTNQKVLVNKGLVKFTIDGQEVAYNNQNDSTVKVLINTSDNTQTTSLWIASAASFAIFMILRYRKTKLN